jgi:hypothetical protein
MADASLDFRLVRNRRACDVCLSFPEERFLVRHASWFLLALILVGCSKPTSTGVSVDSVFLPYIQPNTQAIVFIQFEKLKASELYKKHSGEFDVPEWNAVSDVTALLATWDGKQPLFLAKGSATPQMKERLGRSVTFVDVAPKPSGEGGVPPELEERLKVIAKSAQIWEVSRGGIPLATFPMRSDIQSILANFAGAISETSVGLSFDSGTHFQADFTCVSPAGAQRVHDALRGLVGLARLSANSSDLDMLRLWDAVHVDQDQALVHVRADLSADLTEKFLTYLPKAKGGARRMLQPQ